MANNKHLTLEDRSTIEAMLNDKASFKVIADALDKDPSTISKEVRSLLVFRRIGAMHLNYNSCALRFQCSKSHMCTPCHSQRKYSLCRRCSMCNAFCKDFQREICSSLSKPPYVCNGCGRRYSCSLEKRFYYAQDAQKEYRHVLSESRSGISLSEAEIMHLDRIVTPLVRQKQSPHHICVTDRDSIMVSERTIYRLIDSRIISAMNMELPRKVRYSARKQTVHAKVDRACRIGRDHNDSQSVIDIFERLYMELRPDRFMELFKVCLADNGSEFSNPTAIEYDRQGNPRTRVFYYAPSASYQKGSAERNHEFIRMFIPKGSDMDRFTQADISLMMDHINSYSRKSLGDKCPYEMFEFLYSREILDLLECHRIPPQEVALDRSVFRKEVHP